MTICDISLGFVRFETLNIFLYLVGKYIIIINCNIIKISLLKIKYSHSIRKMNINHYTICYFIDLILTISN